MADEVEVVQNDLVPDIQDDKRFRAAFSVVKYDDLTDRRIIADVRDTFKGFEYVLPEDMVRHLPNVDSLVTYCSEAITDIANVEKDVKIKAITTEGALCVRRWYLASVIAAAINGSSYGSNVRTQIANKLNWSQSYVYAYRKVGQNLTMQQVYALGVYDAGWKRITKLANYVDDRSVRDAIVKSYCDAIKDWNNEETRSRAKKELDNAIEMYKSCKASQDIEASNLLDSADAADAAEARAVTQEFSDVMKILSELQPVVSKLASEEKTNTMEAIFSNFFILSNVEGADSLMSEVTDKAREVTELAEKALENLSVYITQLKSLSNSKVLRAEEQEVTASEKTDSKKKGKRKAAKG